MSSSLSRSVRFLLDENVKKRLETFLKQEGFDAIFKPKGLTNGKLAELSKSEQRVLITNDVGFTNPEHFSSSNIFSVVWLRIPQDKPASLITSFSRLLNEAKSEDFKGKLIILYEDRFEIVLLA